MRKTLLNFAKKHHWFMSLLRFGWNSLINIRYGRFYLFNKVDDKLITFEVFSGKKYADSPKAIYEYMLSNKKYSDYKYIWFFENPEEYRYLEKNKNTKVLKYGSKNYYFYYSRAKYWITNATIFHIIRKRKNQEYIQCWHGTPLKRLGYDIIKEGNAMNSVKDIRKKWKKTATACDFLISPSAFVTEKYKSAFNLKELNPNVKIIEEGYPRNDFLSNYKSSDIDKIKKDLNIPKDKRVILYAPTFRDNEHQSGVGYTYKTTVDFDKLKSKYGNDSIILFRAHYLIANSFDFDKYKDFIYDVSNYDDINHLYIISDLLITDYSSVFFDYSILKRPIIFYMYDLDLYKNSLRDFYFDLDILPGPIVETEEDLINEIEQSKDFKIDKKYKDFNNKFTYLEDGKASKRVIDKIINK